MLMVMPNVLNRMVGSNHGRSPLIVALYHTTVATYANLAVAFKRVHAALRKISNNRGKYLSP